MSMPIEKSEGCNTLIKFNGLGMHGAINVMPMHVESLSPTMTEGSLCDWVGSIAGDCYGSKDDMEKNVARALSCARRGHTSPWEHAYITLRCIVDRGTSHALVRHRHCAFMQSSTIYENFKRYNTLNIVGLPDKDPCNGKDVKQITDNELDIYNRAAREYMLETGEGVEPARARDLIPTCLATTLIITTNIPQWIYMIRRRRGHGDSVRMHCWSKICEKWFIDNYPTVWLAFEQWYDKGRPL